jgi:hypothetical protein
VGKLLRGLISGGRWGVSLLRTSRLGEREGGDGEEFGGSGGDCGGWVLIVVVLLFLVFFFFGKRLRNLQGDMQFATN